MSKVKNNNIKTTETISLIVPCYNEEATINLFYDAVENIKEAIPVEIQYVFIDDGSTDHTLAVLRELATVDPNHVTYLSFSRNFGKEAALYAGLEHAEGDYVAVMDVDLQDPPEMLPKMYAMLQTGEYDCIGTRRVDREGEPPIRSFFAKQFYRIINKISDVDIVDGARDYRLMTRQMVNAILQITEYNRFSKGIFSWVGFETKYLEYKNVERSAGETTWSFWKLLKYALNGIVTFSETPLLISSFIGLISFVASILLALFFAGRTIIFENPTPGWTSLVVLLLGIGGLQLFCLGIVGKYIGQTFLETKNRPIYILKETHNKKNSQ